jgi:AcrR family transcriptional regulator
MRSTTDRNRERTETALIDAVGRVIDDHGVEGLGVNAIAKAAQVDKVLIYRYFGGLEALVAAFARTPAFWPSPGDILGQDHDELLAMPFAERAEAIFRRYVAALRQRPRTLAILASELSERSPLHAPLEAAREEMGMALMSIGARGLPPGVDVAAFATVITGAIHYLLVRSRHISIFNGIRIDNEDGWERIIRMVGPLAAAALAQAEPAPGDAA